MIAAPMMEEKTYVHAATSLQLASWRYFFAFVRASNRAQERLRHSPGRLKHSVRGNLFQLTFQTYSIYEDYESLQDFIYSPEHAAAMQKMAEWSGPKSKTANWKSASSEIDWKEADRRLAEAPTYWEKFAKGKAGVQIKV